MWWIFVVVVVVSVRLLLWVVSNGLMGSVVKCLKVLVIIFLE